MTAAEDAALAESASLIAERDDLRQQVEDLRQQADELRAIEDLRAFERHYRARLLAFHEAQARDLREGQQ